METRRLGRTDLELTVLGIGTWAIGGGSRWRFGWGPQDDDEAVAAVLRGVELGLNWVDTAPVYGDGHSEELVGRALRELGPARRPIVATKCTRHVQPDGTVAGIMKRDSIVAECEASLRRLGVDVIDLYQLHWPLPEEDIEEGWSTLVELQQQGKVACIGVSNFARGDLERAAAIRAVDSLQPPYSMLRREVEAEELPYCAEHGIGVVAYSPMAKGMLTGAFTRERAESLPDDDHRSRDPAFAEPQLSIDLDLVARLAPIAERNRLTLAQLAVAWVLRRPGVTSAILGVRRPAQIESIASAPGFALPDDDLRAIEALLDARDAALAEAADGG